METEELTSVLCVSHSQSTTTTCALTQNHFEIIKNIISWVLQFIREHISAWIRQQGGWAGVMHSVSRWRTVSIVAAVAFITAVVYWRRTR